MTLVQETYDAKDIEKSFNETILYRGRDYVRRGNVLDAWFDEYGFLLGKVRGSDGRTYQVDIEFSPRQRFTKLETSCTCPYSSQCKHAAALALFALGHEIRTVCEDEEEPDTPTENAAFELALRRPLPPPVSAQITVPRAIQDWLRNLGQAAADDNAADPSAKQRISYRLGLSPIGGIHVPTVHPVNQNILKSGALGAWSAIKAEQIRFIQKPAHWTPLDAALMTELEALCPKSQDYCSIYRLDGRRGSDILRRLLSTGRCFWNETTHLSLGKSLKGKFQWQASENGGALMPTIHVKPHCHTLALDGPWYVDMSTGECGPIECGMPPKLAATLLRVAPIVPEFVPAVRSELAALGLPEAVLPQQARTIVVRAPQPVPKLYVDFETCASNIHGLYGRPQALAPIAFAKLTFEYEGVPAPVDGDDVRVATDEQLLILKRNKVAEQQAHEVLQAAGWQRTAYGWDIPKGRVGSLCMAPKDYSNLMEPLERVAAFGASMVPKLIEAGWKADLEGNLRYVPESEVEWDVEMAGGDSVDWFEFRLGIRVEGESFDLRSILAQVFKPETKQQLLNTKAQDVFVFGLNGRAVKLPRERLLAIVQPLMEIFGDVSEWPEDLRLSKSLLSETSKFQESLRTAEVPWRTDEEITRLSKLLANFERLEPVTEPAGFGGELRPYQREGLAWLQFLREYGFGGVLADDMGLGKTVQVLAHIQIEKLAGRLERPCLIIAPTSTIPNWRRECERFVPGLKVLTLQGSDRASRFPALGEADIVLSTYPLLARDKEQLLKWNYHMVVLDEAQNVKNPATSAAKAARELVARHRLCLSGTPVENHLGELWALFEFLMPGFLGSDAHFKKAFRHPIERFGEAPAKERLGRRVRPFMLRRTKSQVVTELPPKTEIIESVEFGDPQRDLYESIRVVMDERVRSLLASQGLDKSRIQILDALLKLRQVCCDPRLVKLPSAREVTESSKLDRLMEMLRVLVEDGRRVLLFSQFTSMLDLIEARLKVERIQWVRISGDTEDRETPVKRFQAGEVPLFLISLKAGGTGLNLTAADTVILYDPWWNPAVENQAIDRAHRIGQDKPVIVYRLVASGTIEEKMLEMQARKGDIARSILSDDADGIRTLTAKDLEWVLSQV